MTSPKTLAERLIELAEVLEDQEMATAYAMGRVADYSGYTFLRDAATELDRLAARDTLLAVMREATAWADGVFPQSTPQSIANHLRAEAAELAADPSDTEEVADCLLLLGHLINRAGIDAVAVMRAKLEKNRLRTWGAPNAEGYAEHVEKASVVLPARPALDEETTRPRITCLCGSSRFIEAFAVLAWELEKDGRVVLGLHYLPPSYAAVHADHQAEAEGVAARMDELHLRKIDLADDVLVLNVDGYIGESARREIAYAEAHGKPVRYVEPLARLAGEKDG